jgi:large subunit ribosomal protein L10
VQAVAYVFGRIFLFSGGENTMPSIKILEQKQADVATLTEKIQNSVSGVVVSYAGITVEDDTKLRKELREAGVEYKVYKNSITGRACENAGYGDIKQYLSGMVAIAVSKEDAVAPAKILKKYADEIPSFEIKAGYIDGEVIGAEKVEALAKIPPKPVLVAKLMGSMKSPVSKLAICLKAIVDKAGAPAEEAAEA